MRENTERTTRQPPFAHLIPVLFQALHGLCATLQLLLHGIGVDFGLSRRDLQSVSYRLLFQGSNQSSLKPFNVWCSLLCRDIMYIQYIQNTSNVQLSFLPLTSCRLVLHPGEKTPRNTTTPKFKVLFLQTTHRNSP